MGRARERTPLLWFDLMPPHLHGSYRTDLILALRPSNEQPRGCDSLVSPFNPLKAVRMGETGKKIRHRGGRDSATRNSSRETMRSQRKLRTETRKESTYSSRPRPRPPRPFKYIYIYITVFVACGREASPEARLQQFCRE